MARLSKKIMKKSIAFKKYLSESLRDPKEASAYLNAALKNFEEDGDAKTFLLLLRDVAEAQGSLSLLAEKTKLNRQNLYRVLSGKGNPTINTLGSILNSLGLKLEIKA